MATNNDINIQLNQITTNTTFTQKVGFNYQFGIFEINNSLTPPPGIAGGVAYVASRQDGLKIAMGITSNYSPDFTFLDVDPNLQFRIINETIELLRIYPNGSIYSAQSYSTNPSAKLEIQGGIQNIPFEDSIIRATGSSNSSKIELNNVGGSGRLYELRSNSDGTFGITDRTSGISRMNLDTFGNLVLTPSGFINGLTINNSNTSATSTGLSIAKAGALKTSIGYNAAADEAYMWSYGTASLKFGTSGQLRLRILNNGDIDAVNNRFINAADPIDNQDLVTKYYAENLPNNLNVGNNLFVSNTIYGRLVSGTMSMQNNAVGTTVTTANTFVKVAGTTTASNLNGLTSPLSNRLTVSSTTPHIALLTVSFTASHNGAGGEETTFALYKNGLQLSNSLVSSQQLNNLQTLSINTTVSMSSNDYIELWCTSPNSGRIITVKRLMFTYTTT